MPVIYIQHPTTGSHFRTIGARGHRPPPVLPPGPPHKKFKKHRPFLPTVPSVPFTALGGAPIVWASCSSFQPGSVHDRRALGGPGFAGVGPIGASYEIGSFLFPLPAAPVRWTPFKKPCKSKSFKGSGKAKRAPTGTLGLR